MIENRIYKTELIEWQKVKDLQPENLKLPYNYENIKNSIMKYGVSKAYDVCEIGGDLYWIDGHTRTQILVELVANGVNIPNKLTANFCKVKDKKEAIEILLEVHNQRQNPIDNEVLSEWIDLEELDVNVDSLNVNIDDIEIEQEVLEAEEDDFDVKTPETPITVLGDLYEIGEHRLLCGDSTQTDTFQKLMKGEIADMVVTDPPYNVAYEGKTKDSLTIENDSMGNDDFYKFLYDFYTALTTAVKKGGSIYVWHSSSEIINFAKAMVDAGWLLKQQLIWVKNTMVMGRQDYQWKHEPCLYGWLNGGSHNWYSDRKQTTIIEWDKPQRNGEHPTMKPIGIFAYQIGNSSKQGDIVIDAFGGSGTTIVACYQLKRKARVIEFDPKYCDVIIKRMIKLDPTLTIKRNGVKIDAKEFD